MIVWAIFAVAYAGVVLLALASAFRRYRSPRDAALLAWAVSAVVHGATVFLAEPEQWLTLSLFWLLPHLLWLPVLLWAASRQTPR